MKVAFILLLIIPLAVLSQENSTSDNSTAVSNSTDNSSTTSNSTTNSTTTSNSTTNSTTTNNSTENSTTTSNSTIETLNVTNLPFLNNITLVAGNDITANPGQAPLNCSCAANMNWICGSDGNSYSNACVANCSNISVAYNGRCLDCNLPCSMNLQPVCGVNNLTHLNLCHLLCISRFQYQSEGWCSEQANCLCVSGGPQVCGIDGNFYASECAANCAGMSLQPYARCLEAYPQWWGSVPNQLDCMHGSVNVNLTIIIQQGYIISNSSSNATNNQTNSSSNETNNQSNSSSNATNNQTNSSSNISSVSVTNPDGSVTNTVTYSDGLILIVTTYPDGSVNTVWEGSNGEIISNITNVNGTITQNTNSTSNGTSSSNGTSTVSNITSVTNADGSVTKTITLNDGSEIIQTTYSNGSVNTVLQDPNGTILSNSTIPAS